MKYAYFPGCSLESTAWDFDHSTRAVCRALGIELEEIPNWVCCGSTPAHSTNASLAVALPVLNLQKAQAMGRPVLTACASCYARLRTANHQVRNETDQRQRAQRITGKPYAGDVEVHHVLDVLVNRFGLDGIRQKVQRRAGRPPRGMLLRLPAHAAAGGRGLRQRRKTRHAWTTWWPQSGRNRSPGRTRQSVAGRACRSRRAKSWGVWAASCS